MSKQSSYSNYQQRVNSTPSIVEVDDRLWEYVIVKVGYFKGKYYNMKKKASALSWNTAAVFVPVQWFSYRKMYLQAVIMWFVTMACNFGVVFALKALTTNLLGDMGLKLTEILKLGGMSQEEATALMTEKISGFTQEQLEFLFQDYAHQMFMVVGIYLFVSLVVYLIVGLTANAQYLNRIEKLVKSEANLGKEQIAVQRVTKGGVSVSAVVISLIFTAVASFFLR